MQAFGKVLRRPHSVTAYTANTASAYERGYAAAAPDVNASAVENAGPERDFACAAAGKVQAQAWRVVGEWLARSAS